MLCYLFEGDEDIIEFRTQMVCCVSEGDRRSAFGDNRVKKGVQVKMRGLGRLVAGYHPVPPVGYGPVVTTPMVRIRPALLMPIVEVSTMLEPAGIRVLRSCILPLA